MGVMLTNKPPGHYRDERGYEYYWDGQRRSYIPNDSFGQFMRNMRPLGNSLVWGYAGAILLGFVLLLVFFVMAAINGGFLFWLIVLVWLGLLAYSINYQKNKRQQRLYKG